MNISYAKIIFILRAWLPFASVATLMCGTVYIAVQQNFRQSANDPQIQIAENAARVISEGVDPREIPDPEIIDIATSISVFIALYDDHLHLIAADGTLHGNPLALPKGVFDYAKAHGQHRVTWQPEPGVRSAVVIVPYRHNAQSGFAVAGRSLRETERRIGALTVHLALAWLGSLLVTLVLIAFLEFTKR